MVRYLCWNPFLPWDRVLDAAQISSLAVLITILKLNHLPAVKQCTAPTPIKPKFPGVGMCDKALHHSPCEITCGARDDAP